MDEQLRLIIPEKQRGGGISLAIVLSFVLHSSLILWFAFIYDPGAAPATQRPIARYVELMKQNPSDFVEAPGRKLDRAPSPRAALSDGNRRAATPDPTGEQPTSRPGPGGMFTPPSTPGRTPQSPGAPQTGAPQDPRASGQQPASATAEIDPSRLNYRERVSTEPTQASAGAVDWRSAIREVGKVASLGGDEDTLRSLGGGEKGFAEQGPLSFETQWYNWGDYAQSMVSKIRVHWYANMPQLIRTGMKGVVTIRFTIQRNGSITDLEIVSSSTVPPYDFAAKKAIELASPLNPLPKDFPNPSERVTAAFYYNMEPVSR